MRALRYLALMACSTLPLPTVSGLDETWNDGLKGFPEAPSSGWLVQPLTPERSPPSPTTMARSASSRAARQHCALVHCAVVGYVTRPRPKETAAQIAAPVTVRKLPARYYCQRSGIDRPAVLAMPCSDAVPPGCTPRSVHASRHSHGYDSGVNLLVYVSWTAHGPVVSQTERVLHIALAKLPHGPRRRRRGHRHAGPLSHWPARQSRLLYAHHMRKTYHDRVALIWGRDAADESHGRGA